MGLWSIKLCLDNRPGRDELPRWFNSQRPCQFPYIILSQRNTIEPHFVNGPGKIVGVHDLCNFIVKHRVEVDGAYLSA